MYRITFKKEKKVYIYILKFIEYSVPIYTPVIFTNERSRNRRELLKTKRLVFFEKKKKKKSLARKISAAPFFFGSPSVEFHTAPDSPESRAASRDQKYNSNVSSRNTVAPEILTAKKKEKEEKERKKWGKNVRASQGMPSANIVKVTLRYPNRFFNFFTFKGDLLTRDIL